jgi:hypothetical protein
MLIRERCRDQSDPRTSVSEPLTPWVRCPPNALSPRRTYFHALAGLVTEVGLPDGGRTIQAHAQFSNGSQNAIFFRELIQVARARSRVL